MVTEYDDTATKPTNTHKVRPSLPSTRRDCWVTQHPLLTEDFFPTYPDILAELLSRATMQGGGA